MGPSSVSAALELLNQPESIAGAGDFDGDGFADVLMGSTLDDPNGFQSGRAYFAFGGPFECG